MKKGGKIILKIGAVLFVFMLASLLLMSQSLQNSELFDRYYLSLLVFNMVGLISLIALILLNIKRLIRQLKNHVVGSRMTIRMVGIFSLLSVTPVLIVYYFSLDFLHQGIDSWFDLRVEQALNDSLELSQLALDVRMRELFNITEQVADELSEVEDTAITFEIEQARTRINANELTLLTKNGMVIASSASDTSSLIPDIPDEAILLQLLQGSSYTDLDVIKDTGRLIRVVINLPDIASPEETRMMQALFPVSPRVNQLTENVQSAFTQYEKLSYLREQLKISFIITLTLVLLFSIFSAVWAAFYSARNLVAPVTDLAEGTRAIAKGNYSTHLPVPGKDELGFLVASFNDMTDKIAQARDTARQSQQKAEAQHTYLETILSRLSSGVMVFDQNKKLELANIAASQILALELSENKRDDLPSLLEKYPALEVLLKCISGNIEDMVDDWREQITLPDEMEPQVLMVNGTTLTGTSGEIDGYVIVFDEITELIKGQRNAAWSEMARRLAHEIKNPLTPIQLAAERLRHKYLTSMNKMDSATLDRMTNTIVQQVETMKEMVNNFSDYASSPNFTRREIKVEKLFQEVLDLFSNLDDDCQIKTDIERGLPAIVGDEKKLRRMFNNLLANAFDANTLNNNNCLEITAKKVLEKDNEMIEIRIIDNGSGLDNSIAHKIFEPYVTSKQKGTGLGLTIVKKIIDEHKGRVWLENNRERQGACAVVRLPAACPEPS